MFAEASSLATRRSNLEDFPEDGDVITEGPWRTSSGGAQVLLEIDPHWRERAVGNVEQDLLWQRLGWLLNRVCGRLSKFELLGVSSVHGILLR